MIPAVQSPIIPYSAQASAVSLNWQWLEDLPLNKKTGIGLIISTEVSYMSLTNTQFSCSLSTLAGAWENRLVFIKKIVEDIVKRCPKDEEVAIVSLGSGHLLIEYIIGKALIENDFQKISLFLIDPVYRFQSNQKEAENTKELFKEFRERIGSSYSDKWNEPFPKERIHYLSRAQNVEKYFVDNSNVVLLESLPPYGQIKNTMKKYNLLDLKPEEFFMGSLFVPAEHANAIAFLPSELKKTYLKVGATFNDSLPLVAFKNMKSNSNYCIDWGCKIYPNGKFFLNFFGGRDYYQSKGLSDDLSIVLPNGKEIISNQLIPSLKEIIEIALQQKIDLLKKGDPEKMLSQTEIMGLLTLVKEELYKFNFRCESFFLADYAIDRSGLVSFLSAKAGHHYRKAFSLTADPYTIYKIDETTLM